MDTISVRVRENIQLPKLCWLLQFSIDSGKVELCVGSKVERLKGAIVEGCWDGDFDAHGLESKNLFGSAVKWRGNRLTVLGSISLTDRICYAKESDRIIVSNSVFAVMGAIGANFDEEVNYYKLSYAPLAGIDCYPTKLPIQHESISVIHQLYHRNMEIKADGRIEVRCKTRARKFSSYKAYEDSLQKTVNEIVANTISEKRTHRVFPYATLSSGYDSTAVAALAKEAGITSALLCTKPKSRHFDLFGNRYLDDGSEAGQALNFSIQYVNLCDYIIDEDEVLYIAPAASTPETSFLPMAKYIESKQCLGAIFTGYHGDKIWDKNVASKYINDQLIRGDMSGVNISESRLKSGFFNVAVPFLFARSAESIILISQSEEMSQWSVGGGYDRPIARRIAEERGVLRGSFGIRKRAIIDRYPEPRNSVLAENFKSFMKDKYKYSIFSFVWSKWRYLISVTIGRKFKAAAIKSRSRDDLSYWMWFWAANNTIDYYKKITK